MRILLQMDVDAVFELVGVGVQQEDAMLCGQAQQVSRCRASNPARAASDDDVFGFSPWHLVAACPL